MKLDYFIVVDNSTIDTYYYIKNFLNKITCKGCVGVNLYLVILVVWNKDLQTEL